MTPIRKWVPRATLSLVILLAPLFSEAFQPDSTNNPPPPNPLPPGSMYAPADSGIVFLLIAGLGLGIITVVANRKNRARQSPDTGCTEVNQIY